jgi:DNA topoisomerase-1
MYFNGAKIMEKKNFTYKNLLIVESPAKAKTINKYLGKDYKVMASVGHVIDLPKSKLGVDVEHNYEPLFEIIYGKGKIIKDLKRAVPKDGKVFLAMDPDREGEAIAWHVNSVLKAKNVSRVTFNEITKDAILEAVKHPTKIDENLVEAQKARRVLDRLVGYKLSELLWKKVWYGLSAGRVQSVALRLIVEREEEREAFKAEEYWDFGVEIKDENKNTLNAKLVSKDGKKYIPKNKEAVDEVEKILGSSDYIVKDVTVKPVKKHPYPPFTTSTLQQSANNVLGFSSKRTMGIAQILYQAGFITYMRTDSFNMSSKAVDSIRDLIKNKYGSEYLPSTPNYYKTHTKGAQEAHEAIRPTDILITKERIEKEFGSAEAKLYDLIWKRAVSCQMTDKRAEVLTVSIVSKDVKKPEYVFTLGGEMTLFDGFRKVLGHGREEEDLQEIAKIEKGDILNFVKFVKEQKFTQPPARYNDASLVKKLEALEIGRPSTYATIISTIEARGYVVKEAKALIPTDVGRVVTNLLRNNFKRLVDYEYTAKVEGRLDAIAEGKDKYVPVIDAEYKPLIEEIAKADKDVKKDDVVILGKSEEKCPECGADMIVRVGRFGKFLSCSRFPECKGMKDLSGNEESLDYNKYLKPDKCPKCGGPLVLKNGKYGKFWACKDYPKCKGIVPLLLVEKCPECGHPLVERRSKWGKKFTGCSNYPECKYIKKEYKKKTKKEI